MASTFPRRTRVAAAIALIVSLAGVAPPASAFCGFYVGKADAKLFNEASQVILARDGNRTVIGMRNDFQGELTDFALIVPVPPQHLAVEALVSLLASAEKVRTRISTKGRLLGILLTMVDPKRAPASELRERVRAQYRERVFLTEIPESRALEDAPAAGKTIFEFAPRSRAADAFRRLGGEVLERFRPRH